MENKATRNSVIELLRFVFAFFIVFYHNLFVVEIPLFNNANYFVDFFFIITGFFMVSTIQKYDEKPVLKGTYQILIDRIKKIGLPLLISYVAVVLDGFISHPDSLMVRYLWFIHIMLIAYVLFFLLYRAFRKNTFVFYLIVGVICLATFAMRFGCLIFWKTEIFETTYFFDELRGLSMITLGMFMRFIPKIKWKDEKKGNIISFAVVTAMFALLLFSLRYSCKSMYYKRIVEVIADFGLFPLMFYFAQNIKYENKWINILGSCSIYIYIYQCICLFEQSYGVTSKVVQFASLMIITIITIVIKEELKKKKLAKQQEATKN